MNATNDGIGARGWNIDRDNAESDLSRKILLVLQKGRLRFSRIEEYTTRVEINKEILHLDFIQQNSSKHQVCGNASDFS